MSKVVAFMPIKLNNERIPGKNLKPMTDGKILISFMLEVLAELKEEQVFDEVVVYCSKEKICEYLPESVRWIPRPDFLDTATTTSNDIIRCFLGEYQADIYAMCHATSPFMRKNHIKECVDAVLSGEYDSAFCGREIQNFLWQNGKPLNFSREYYPRTQDLVPIYEELPTPYVFTKEVFEKTGGRTGDHPYICKCSVVEAVDVDMPDDFALADAIHSALIDKMDL